MSPIKKAAILLLLLFSIPLGLVLFKPNIVLAALLKSSANQLGYEIVSMQVGQLGLRETTLDQLSLRSESQLLEFTDMVVRYSPEGLLAAQVESVQIALTEIRMLETSSPSTSTDETTPSSLFESFDDIPIAVLELGQIEYRDDNNGNEARLSLQSPPLQMEGYALTESLEDVVLEFTLQRAAGNTVDIAANVRLFDALALESNMKLVAVDSALSVVASNTIFLGPLREQIRQYLPASTQLLNEQMTLDSEFDVQNVFADPSLSRLRLALNSPSSTIHITQDSDLGTSDMQLQLPIRLQGDIANSAGEIRISLSEILGTGSYSLGDLFVQLENSLVDTQLSCMSFSSCDLSSDWQSKLIRWQLGEYSGDNLSVSAPLRFNYSNNEMRLATDLAELSIPSLQMETNPAELQFATTMQLDELELRVGDVISGGFNFSSSRLRVDNKLLAIENPAYSGKLQLEDDIVTGILEFDLDQRLRLGFGLQHFLLRDTGDVVIQVAAHEFTEAEPLSSLLAPKQLDADIVAGQIEGLANISWSKQQDDSWRFGGPVALKLAQLSGYYADYFFVDLNTDLFAEATTPLGIQVSNPASATLGRVDIGLPLENLSWQYRFDSLTGDLQLNDFTTELLGGRLSIPALRYNPARERQQVDVVIADLNVEALVALAEYPGIYADGMISGYLPFIIEGDTVTIEKGLVGALNPGGNIRYTPTASVPSSNASLRLVNEALANYQYQSMNTEVFYDAQGELLLSLQLQGRNPDMNNGQAINLNMNISDNVPSLLKSLQASRVITDELERFMQQR